MIDVFDDGQHFDHASIIILTGAHLCHNPRAVKEADALTSAGYNVELLGAWFNESLAAHDRLLMAERTWKFTVVADLRPESGVSRWQRRYSSLRRKAANYRYRALGWPHPYQLGYVVRELYQAARSKHGMLIAHSEQAMWVAERLRRQGRVVGIDMEDWFSSDLPQSARRERPVSMVEQLERSLLQSGVYRLCTSRAMSQRLSVAYEVPPPSVVYNVFPWSDRGRIDGMCKDRRNRFIPSIHWFSQTLGSGRGIEQLLSALPLLQHPVEVHLRGQPSADWPGLLDRHCPPACRKSVFVHPLVSNEELLSRIAEHDIGFAGEQRYAESRDVTVTNKLFQYLLGGLGVVATDTSGQREIAMQAPDAIKICRGDDGAALAAALNPWLASAEALQMAKQAALMVARDRFCWEVESTRVIDEAQAAFGARTRDGH